MNYIMTGFNSICGQNSLSKKCNNEIANRNSLSMKCNNDFSTQNSLSKKCNNEFGDFGIKCRTPLCNDTVTFRVAGDNN